MEGYAVIRIKKSTKDILDKEKKESGKLLWYLIDEAVRDCYLTKERKEQAI